MFLPSHCKRTLILLLILVSPMMVAANEGYDTLDKPTPLPEFNLVDQNGDEFGLADFKGHWSLVFLGFTACPDICPLTMMKLEAVRAELGLRFRPEQIPEIVFVAVDPQRDKPVLKSYLAHFHPANIGVTGLPDQIDALVKGLDGFYRIDRKLDGSTNYQVVHTSSVAVINPQGFLVQKIAAPLKVYETAEQLMLLIRQGGSIEQTIE